MMETAATVVFQPDGQYADDSVCTWAIMCPDPSQVPTITFQQFATEQDYDYVSIYDGPDVSYTQIAHLSGDLRDISQRSYGGTSYNMGATGCGMVVQLTTDASVGGGGFNFDYNCGGMPPPPPPPPAPPPPPPPAPPACLANPCAHGTCTDATTAPACHESCLTHGDGECDDGGANSMWVVCSTGTDCADCGPRPGFTCACSAGWDGPLCDNGLPPPAPPPPPARNKREVVLSVVANGMANSGHVMAPGQEVWYSFPGMAGRAYQMETNTEYPYGDGVLDSTMRVCSAHPCPAGPPLAENDDDTRAAAGAGTLESYLEWTAPSDGTFFVIVNGYGTSVGTFSMIVDQMPDPCDLTNGRGMSLIETSATISFLPQGDMAHHPGHMMCDWVVTCPDQSKHVQLTFDNFMLNPSPTSGDHVALFDGGDDTAHKFRPNGQLSGGLASLPQTTFTSTGASMLIQFTCESPAK